LNKRAIELSINFIVLFILAMAMFATGITLTYKIFNKADVMKTHLDEKTSQEIMNMLTQGSAKIIVPVMRKTVEPGGSDVFGIGIRNDEEDPQQFYINVDCDAAYKADKSTICEEGTSTPCSSHPSNCNSWLSSVEMDADNYVKLSRKVNRNERVVEELFVIVPKSQGAEEGTYVFNLRVCTAKPCTDENIYGTTKKLYVVVP